MFLRLPLMNGSRGEGACMNLHNYYLITECDK